MMKIKIIFFILFVVNVLAQAEEISIVEVKRNIPLSDDDPVYKDYAINAGASAGLKKNMVVLAKRRLAVKDGAAKTVGEVETTVGQLKIIHVDGKISIAREYKLTSRDEEVMLEQIGIMTGDRIDLAGSFIDSKPLIYKKKSREPSSAPPSSKDTPSSPDSPNAPTTPPAVSTPPVSGVQPAPLLLQIKPNTPPLPEI